MLVTHIKHTWKEKEHWNYMLHSLTLIWTSSYEPKPKDQTTEKIFGHFPLLQE